SAKLAIAYDDHGMRKLATITTKGKIKDLTDTLSGTTLCRPYLSGQFSANFDGEIAFTKGSSSRPADVAVTTSKGKVKSLTALNEDLLAHKTLGKVHEITY
ncbi:peptidase S9 family protein, partial [Pseudoalteromonas piscicida]